MDRNIRMHLPAFGEISACVRQEIAATYENYVMGARAVRRPGSSFCDRQNGFTTTRITIAIINIVGTSLIIR
jgi:hypothetical protein